MSWEFLPIQLIYQGTTKGCHKDCIFPDEFHVTQNKKHWANETTSIQLLEKFIIPNVKKTRQMLGLSENYPWLLISDVFKGQWTDAVKDVVEILFKEIITEKLKVGLTFSKDIGKIVQAHNIPNELIINLDQTPLPFLLISKYSMNKKGEKSVPIS